MRVYERFVEIGNDANLAQAVALARRAVRSAADDHPMRPLLLAELRDLLRYCYDLRGRAADLDEAVQVALAAFETVPSESPEHLRAIQVAVALLRSHSEVTGEVDLLREWFARGARALEWGGDAERERGHLESGLCGALVSLAINAPVDVDFDQAVKWGRAAVCRLPPGDVVAAINLGEALLARGSVEDVDAAVEVLRAAAALRTAGFRHTVATLWSVYDKAARDITEAFYRRVHTPASLDSANAAVALHEAVAVLRDEHLTDPIVWAPFVHDGP